MCRLCDGPHHIGWQFSKYSKSNNYKWVPFPERIPKSDFVHKSNKVSLGTQLTQLTTQYCTVTGL